MSLGWRTIDGRLERRHGHHTAKHVREKNIRSDGEMKSLMFLCYNMDTASTEERGVGETFVWSVALGGGGVAVGLVLEER